MDKDLAARLDGIDATLRNFAATLAILLQRQTQVGERLAAIEALLTPEPEDPARPKLRDLIEQGFAAEEVALRLLSRQALDLRKAVQGLPLETVRAIDDNLGPFAKAAP